jgi:hypothetical protein
MSNITSPIICNGEPVADDKRMLSVSGVTLRRELPSRATMRLKVLSVIQQKLAPESTRSRTLT